MRIVFVCTGDTCRSPFAAAVAERETAGLGGEWQIASAGLRVSAGDRASGDASAAAAELGLDLSAHRAQPLTPQLIEWADLVVPVTAWHAGAVRDRYGAEKIRILSGTDVEDPVGRGPDTYRRVYGEIEAAVRELLDELKAR